MADDKVIIDIQLNDGQVKTVFNSLSKSAKESSKEAASNLDSFLGSSFTKLGAAAAAAGAAIGAALFSKASITAAMEAEAGIQRLNQSLANAGRYSSQASQSFIDLAGEIQRTTTIEDDAVFSIAALANNFAKTTEQAQGLTKAAIELSAATGKDLNSSVEVLGKTLSGSAGLLTKQIPELQNFTKEQLKAGAAIDVVLARFSGSAASQVNTFSGALTQAKNSFGDLLEEIGNFIVKDKAVIVVIKTISEVLNSAAQGVANFRTQGEGTNTFLQNMIILTVRLAESINTFLVGPLRFLFQILQTGALAVITAWNGMFSVIFNILNDIAKFLPDTAGFSKIKSFLETESKDLTDKVSQNFADLSTSAEESLTMGAGGAAGAFLAKLRTDLENANSVTQEFKNNTNSTFAEISSGVSYQLFNIGTAFETVAESASAAMLELRINAEKNFKAAGAAMVNGMGTAAGNAFAAFGKAIATGEDALQGFLNSLLASIGQASIQLGTNFILQGLAYMWAGMPNGGALIAAGAGLAAFGGLLAGMGGGAATAPSPGTPGGSPVMTQPMTETPLDQTVEERTPQNDVTVNIRGDVLDSDETGLRIVDIINSAFDKQGVVIKRGVVA